MVSTRWSHLSHIQQDPAGGQRNVSGNADFQTPDEATSHGHPEVQIYPQQTSFYRGYLKSRVYIDKPNTLRQLKEKISKEMSTILWSLC